MNIRAFETVRIRAFRYLSLTALVGALSLAVAAPPASAQIQNAAQRRCISKVNAAAAKAGAALRKELAGCVKDASAGQDVGGDVTSCAVNSLKLAAALGKTISDAQRYCVSDTPDFAFSDAENANDAILVYEVSLVDDILGGLTEGIVSASEDRDGARCQAAIVKSYGRVAAERLKAFNRCVDEKLRTGAAEAGSLEVCLDDEVADPKNKIAKAEEKLEKDFLKRCGALDFNGLFPGSCSGAPDMLACFDHRLRCHGCVMLNQIEGMARNCESFDDGDFNFSCFDPEANECLGENVPAPPCDVNASCTDLQTGFDCSCNAGWNGSGIQCVDDDECAGEGIGNDCDVNATCENLDGTFDCACNEGYEGSGRIEDCLNIDECALETDNCDDVLATCTDSDGGFVCECIDGYVGDGTVDSCLDANECLGEGLGNNCDVNAACTNTVGSFTCACNPGFTGDGLTCVDDNECAGEGSGNNCDTNATCTNTDGGFTCACNAGYTGTGVVGQCVDIDECGLGTDNCNINATCTNTLGSFSCACNAGFSGTGVQCDDDNECNDEGAGNNCDVNATCSNSIGSFSCSCNGGYGGDGVTCLDLNECIGEGGGDNCHAEATCTNTDGGFTCACNTGYAGSGVVCVDVNECAGQGSGNNCSVEAECTNLPGSFDCECRDHFYGNPFGSTCSQMAVDITSPGHGLFTQANSVGVTGTVTASPFSDYVLTVNGSPVPISGSAPNGTFSTSVPLDTTPNQFNGIVATLQQIAHNGVPLPAPSPSDEYPSARDRVVQIKGPSHPTGTELTQSVALRITDTGFDALEPILTNLVDFDINGFFPPNTDVLGGSICVTDSFLGCIARVDSATINSASLQNVTITMDSQVNHIDAVISLINLYVDLRVRLTISGIGTTCDSFALSSALTTINGDYALQPDPGDRNVIDVNQTSHQVNLGGFSDNVDCGGIGFLSFLINTLGGNFQGLFEDSLNDFMGDPDGGGPADAPIAQAIEDALGGIELTGPIGDGFGVDLQTPLFDIPEDVNGITLASGSIMQPLNAAGTATIPWDFSHTLVIPSSFPTGPLAQANTPGGVPYGMGIVISESGFNVILAALATQGILDLEITELALAEGSPPVQLSALLFSALFPEFANVPDLLTAQLAVRLSPTLAPALSGNRPSTGEIAEFVLPHLLVEMVQTNTTPSTPAGKVWASLAVDLFAPFDLVSDPGGLAPVLAAPKVTDIEVVLLDNPLFLEQVDMENVLPALLVGAFDSAFGSFFAPFPLPQFLGIQPSAKEVNRIPLNTGKFLGIFLDVN